MSRQAARRSSDSSRFDERRSNQDLVARRSVQSVSDTHAKEVQKYFALVEQYPDDAGLRRKLADAYFVQGNDDETIAGWWKLLCRHPHQIGILKILRDACYRKRGLSSKAPELISLVYFGWLCLLSFLSGKVMTYGIRKVNWWPLASDDELMMLRPYMVKHEWTCVSSPSFGSSTSP